MQTILNLFTQTYFYWLLFGFFLLAVIIRDVFIQKSHTITHNFPIIGHIRYWIEKIGPELRQYIVANNREELPFNRQERSWIYASSKNENNLQGFGSDQDFNSPGYIFIKNAMMGFNPPKDHFSKKNPGVIPAAKVMGTFHNRKRPYRPHSIINISGMSFGSLSAKAVESLNKGALQAGCYHNTGEGSISPYHTFGSDIVLNIGTAYFGVRDIEGSFSMEKLLEKVNSLPQLRAIEVKLSQGAKPGKGGMLPGSKVDAEIAAIRGIEIGKDAFSPAFHKEFNTIPEMVGFIEKIADATGLPVGIKSAIGRLEQWEELAKYMNKTGKGPDFITIDGGEGGTGAAPHAFADHVSMPFTFAFAKVYQIFQREELTDKIFFIASGKLGFPEKALMAFAMGADSINIAREAMLSIGCIQAQKCHTNHCPTGIATSNKWLQSGIDITLKSERFYRYHYTLVKEISEITHAMGYEHPCEISMDDLEFSMGDNNRTIAISKALGYHKTKIEFDGFEKIIKCDHIGGIGSRIHF
ncbi:FMN-binding glutamate synthase family protein [Sandaracinomonas limnophila]|uniref:FMN-binding glutamate synthase family protein n=1 Tax=Sandaracinomonas limnophila TaxID=1862386 RepID=A0A437PX18_9BACT|nr:FMN-binding glutamate synthase family protein [Sandaracinomonas limnophila]RVU26792.1 FMN-binding glutamate synthase family protein [Sandaracinomonas limnophila]